MDRTAPAGRAARLLAVLAVLLGLLAMHGLASSHHSVAAAASPAVAQGAGPVAQDHEAGTHGHHASNDATASAVAVTAMLPDAGAPDSGLGGACTDCDVHSAAVLCLAVLSAGLALLTLLIALRARARGLPAPPQRLPLLRAGPPLRLGPPDLVSQLCVSRT